MIRAVATVAFTTWLVLVLYLPAVTPAERYLEHVQAEHARLRQFWGPAPAMRVMARMLAWQTAAPPARALPAPDAPQGSVNSATAREMAAVHRRVSASAYGRALDATLMLATYRFATLLAWLPATLALIVALLVDGAIVRRVKSREFLQHDPELFAVHVCAVLVTLCAALIAGVMPVTLPPLVLPGVPVAMALFASRALAHYHRRG